MAASAPDLTAEPFEQAEPRLQRKLVSETETSTECRLCRGDGDFLDDEARTVEPCAMCQGSGQFWRVTSRTYQVGVPFEEATAHAYIRSLHAHIRKAAKSVDVAADMLQQAGRTLDAQQTRQVAKAILEPVEGQD